MLIDWLILEYMFMKDSVVFIGAINTTRCMRDIPERRPRKR
jgi:hypothetical protein